MIREKKVKRLLGSAHNCKLLFNRKSEVVFIYLFLALFIIFGTISSEHFWGTRNLHNLLSKNIGILLVTFGQMYVILLGGVDLSTGSVISLVNVMCVQIMVDGKPFTYILAAAVCVLAGISVGLINGVLVTAGKIQPIIATLATQTIVAGIALIVQPKPGGELPKKLCDFVAKGWNYKIPLLILLGSSLIMWLLLNRTKLGRSIIAVGGNEQSARASGIRVGKTKISAFVISGMMAAFAGLYISAYAKSGSPIIGESYSQNSITAAVVGGASLMGGKASVLGCIAAAFILGIVSNILNLLHVSAFYQYVMTGLILMVALTLSALKSVYR